MTLISRRASRIAGRTFAVAAAASAIALGVSVTSAGVARADALLIPDPAAYCETNLPFAMQTAVNGWQVQYDQLLGNSYTNNWRCEYWVSAVVPTLLGADGEEADFTLPPFTSSTPIDWNSMCDQQFSGSWAVWIPGPVTGVAGAPWGCQAPAGVTYDPAEDANGVHAVLSS